MSDFGNKEIMAENIKYFLKVKGVSATDVCEKLNVPKSTFSNWCTGKTYPRIDKIEALANYFNCQKSDLVEKRESKGIAAVLKQELDKRQAKLLAIYNSLTKEEQRMAMTLMLTMLASRDDDEEEQEDDTNES